MKELIEKEIQNSIAERQRLFDMLIDNELPNVGQVIIQTMNEHSAVILALKNILRSEKTEQSEVNNT